MAFLFQGGAKIGIAVLLSTQSINHVGDGVDKILAAAFVFEGEEEELHFVKTNLKLILRIIRCQEDDGFLDGLTAVVVIIVQAGADSFCSRGAHLVALGKCISAQSNAKGPSLGTRANHVSEPGVAKLNLNKIA